MITTYQININIYINFNYTLLYNGSIERSLHTVVIPATTPTGICTWGLSWSFVYTTSNEEYKWKTKVTRMLVWGPVKSKIVMGKFGHFCMYIITSPRLTVYWAWHKRTLWTPQKWVPVKDYVCLFSLKCQLWYSLMHDSQNFVKLVIFVVLKSYSNAYNCACVQV